MENNTQSSLLSECRICGSKELREYLNLGKTPLANSYLTKEQLIGIEFKERLTVLFCENCSHSQLSHTVNPERMFKHYHYASSTPATFRRHCDELASAALKLLGLPPDSLILDIASNDGCLLSKFQELGFKVIGVDPAKNLAAEANSRGIPTINDYWSADIAEYIRQNYGEPSIVTGTNIIAHVHNVHGFVSAVRSILPEKGVLILECPYLIDFIRKNEFDTIYHEHLSYFGMHAMTCLVEQHQLEIFRHDYFPDIHGGTVSYYIGHKGRWDVSDAVYGALRKEKEEGFTNIDIYIEFASRIHKNKTELMKLLYSLKQSGKVIWGYGASAKGNTLMNYFGITAELIDCIVDDNHRKWNLYTPGSHIRIIGIEDLNHKVDYLLLLAWNFRREIRERCQKAGYSGKFILPIPKPEIIE